MTSPACWRSFLRRARHRLRGITFLLCDHIGGVNTLSNAGCVITVQDRSPNTVIEAVAHHRAEFLPTSPAFLNQLLLSEAWRRHDLSSLQVLTYGTEPMPESTLKRVHVALPSVRLQQTYDLFEVRRLRSKSRESESLWIKETGEGFETRIVDGILLIHARFATLGYLSDPSPFDQDGQFNTDDQVEIDGEYLRFLGRKSEMNSVGGAKVLPMEVESVLQIMDGVRGVAVSGEHNPIAGQILLATVSLSTNESRGRLAYAQQALLPGQAGILQNPAESCVFEWGAQRQRFRESQTNRACATIQG